MTGPAAVDPNATTSLPVSSSERKSTSSIRWPACSTSTRAWSIRSCTAAPGREAESSNARMRASGVRSSCETAAVKLMRSAA